MVSQLTLVTLRVSGQPWVSSGQSPTNYHSPTCAQSTSQMSVSRVPVADSLTSWTTRAAQPPKVKTWLKSPLSRPPWSKRDQPTKIITMGCSQNFDRTAPAEASHLYWWIKTIWWLRRERRHPATHAIWWGLHHPALIHRLAAKTHPVSGMKDRVLGLGTLRKMTCLEAIVCRSILKIISSTKLRTCQRLISFCSRIRS